VKTFDKAPADFPGFGAFGGHNSTWTFVTDEKLHFIPHKELGTNGKDTTVKRSNRLSALRMFGMVHGLRIKTKWDENGVWIQASKKEKL
jgi:hypothetical protein